MSERLHVCKICGKKFATPKAMYGHLQIHSTKSSAKETFDDDLLRIGRCSLSGNLRVCKICGKKFATSRSLCGHLRIHSGKSNRNGGLQRIWGLYSVSSSLKESSMTEIEQHEMNEAAVSLVMFSEQVYDFAPPPSDIPMDLEVKHCGESKLDFSELLSHSGFEKPSTCSDVVAQNASPLTSELQKKPESNVSYKFKICGKSFGRSQALGNCQRLDRSIRGQLARKREAFEGGNSLSGLSEAKKIVSQPSSFEVSQEELLGLGDTNVKEHCVEAKQDFSVTCSHTGFEKSGSCSDVFVAPALPSQIV